MLLPIERSVFPINAETAVKLKSARESGLGPKTVPDAVGASESVAEPNVQVIGKMKREGFSIEKMAIRLEKAFKVPALLFVPAKPRRAFGGSPSEQASLAAITSKSSRPTSWARSVSGSSSRWMGWA